MSTTRVTDEDLKKALLEKEKKPGDEKQRWVQKMIKKARQYHKICPYFDKRTKMCFLTLGQKCDREGKFDVCPVFKSFLEKKYDEFKAKNLPLPLDFADLVASPL